MKELITIGSVSYAAKNIDTGINTISFVLSGLTADEAHAAFKNARSLTVGEEGSVYGEYPNVAFESIMIDAEGEITVTMHILSKIEVQIRELQTAQAELQVATAEHDEVIAAMMFGGEA